MSPPSMLRPPRSSALCAVAALTCALVAAPALAAAEATPPPPAQMTFDVKKGIKPLEGDLDKMIERQTIRVLTSYNKTHYFIDKGIQRGLTYDAFRLFEDDLNKQLAKARKQKHLKVRVLFIPVSRDQLLPALAAGKGDIAAANLTVTPERQKLVDFSAPVYPDVSEVVVSGPASPAVASVQDLAGKQVFVRKSSSYYESLVALNRDLAAKKLPAVQIKEVPETLGNEDLIEMVGAGLIPLTIVDKHIADFWKMVFPRVTVHDTVTVRSGGSIAWAIRKGSPRLKAALDDFLVRHGKGTTTGNTLLNRYLKDAKYVKDATSETERKKFLALVQYFQSYAQRYSLDWLLMAAQGYQESQLDHSARSKVGAIGVMQVMPATGRELGVGDVRELEANIHAGIKYTRLMIDRYYDKEPMTQVDKMLFAFASYNAGPARVRQLRQEAARRGFDPNVWFHNVEYVAAEKIGAETVTYVGNIYKYYIAYKLVQEARTEHDQAAAKLKAAGK
ncbi:lytic transglycosylase F [Sulfurisoma sediminicola]|uniref:Membrane-bound lytic murein transglycosylase MltF n=1 Tax=Sulfurisoma sediminicola TaxID=1381557 RepID=A0A497XDU3_9PROT|nr:lytic transglycosylase F [Sulfurisoma sediminicola]RLJ65150.1 membrane-bound lytic murein transglycosylase MltF [Sulfurisoma sediminicola]